jgi:hypothetical protein
MFRFRLRTLLILLAVGPPLLAWPAECSLRIVSGWLIPLKQPSPYDFVVISGGGIGSATNLKLRAVFSPVGGGTHEVRFRDDLPSDSH